MLKIIFKNKKNTILIYFKMKSTLKNNHHHTLKYPLNSLSTFSFNEIFLKVL